MSEALRGGKRGRKQDDTLPPSRSRDIQRAFRARKAEYVSTLEARIKRLETENGELRARLGDPPRSITPPPLHGIESPVDIADQVINSVRAATTAFTVDPRLHQTDQKPNHPHQDHDYHNSTEDIAISRSAHPQIYQQPYQEDRAQSQWSQPPPLSTGYTSPTLPVTPAVYSVPPPHPSLVDPRFSQQHHASYTAAAILAASASNGTYWSPTRSALISPVATHHSPASSRNSSIVEIDPRIPIEEILSRSLPLRGFSPSPETEATFIRACCIPSSSQGHTPAHPNGGHAEMFALEAIQNTKPSYLLFCKSLLRGLEITGKGTSGRTSFTDAELRERSARTKSQCCEGIVDCTDLFNDENSLTGIPSIPEGYITVYEAWDMLEPICLAGRSNLSPGILAEMVLDSGQPIVPIDRDTDPSLRSIGRETIDKYVSTNIRCERHHGLLIIEGIVEGVLATVHSNWRR